MEARNALSGQEVGVALFDGGRVDERIGAAALFEVGAVLRVNFDFLEAQRIDDAGVFGMVRVAVAAGHGETVVLAHGGESAHADAADSDEVQMFHCPAGVLLFSGSSAGSGGMFICRSTRCDTRLKVGTATVAA